MADAGRADADTRVNARLRLAIQAQERLRGTLPDDVIDAAIAVLTAQLQSSRSSDSGEALESRRVITVLFADLAGYTAMSEGQDPETVASLMNELWAEIDRSILCHGGEVDKHIGDAVMGVWGSHDAHEDDAERAVRAALEIRDRVVRFSSDRHLGVSVRVGVNTGRALYGRVGTTGEVSVTGDAVNVASRIEQRAPTGAVLISQDTFRAVRGAFDVQRRELIQVKGKSRPLQTYIVDRPKPRSFRMPLQGVGGRETVLVGRDREFGELKTAFGRVVEQRQPGASLVVGEPGAGKSRLLAEFLDWLDIEPTRTMLFRGRALTDEQRIPRSALRQLFAERFEIRDDDSQEAVVEMLVGGFAPLDAEEALLLGRWLGFAIPEPTSWVSLVQLGRLDERGSELLHRYFRSVAETSPVAVLVEDIHWADADSLRELASLVEFERSALFVVCTARPVVLTAEDGQRSARRGWHEINLSRLDDDAARRLVREILAPVESVPDEVVDVVVDRADGNPLHIEELVKAMIDDGAIVVRDDEPWEIHPEHVNAGGLAPTLAGAMQARLDRLAPMERYLMQCAAILGRRFWDTALIALGSSAGAPLDVDDMNAALSSLVRRGLVVRQPRSSFDTAHEYTFGHALMRDAAYETVLVRDRGRLHRTAAHWLEEVAGVRVGEHLGSLVQHFLLGEDQQRAYELLERVARQARRAGDLTSAVDAYTQALEIRAAGERDVEKEAVVARIDLARSHFALGDQQRAQQEFALAAEDAERLQDHELAARSRAEDLFNRAAVNDWSSVPLLDQVRPSVAAVGGDVEARVLSAEAIILLEGPNRDLRGALRAAERALELWSDHGEVSDVLRAINLRGVVLMQSGRHREAAAVFDDGITRARRAGDAYSELLLLSNQANNVDWGARAAGSQGHEAVARWRDVLEFTKRIGIPCSAELQNLAEAEIRAGMLTEARKHLHDALSEAEPGARLPKDLDYSLLAFAHLALAEGERERAVDILRSLLAHRATPRLEEEVAALSERFGLEPESLTCTEDAPSIDDIVATWLGESPDGD